MRTFALLPRKENTLYWMGWRRAFFSWHTSYRTGHSNYCFQGPAINHHPPPEVLPLHRRGGMLRWLVADRLAGFMKGRPRWTMAYDMVFIFLAAASSILQVMGLTQSAAETRLSDLKFVTKRIDLSGDGCSSEPQRCSMTQSCLTLSWIRAIRFHLDVK